MIRALAPLALLLAAAAAPAQVMFDFLPPSPRYGSCTVIDWGGRPVLVILPTPTPGPVCFGSWTPQSQAVFRITLQLVGIYAADARPCACTEPVLIGGMSIASSQFAGRMCASGPGLFLDLSPSPWVFQGGPQGGSLVLDYSGGQIPNDPCRDGRYWPDMAVAAFAVGLR